MFDMFGRKRTNELSDVYDEEKIREEEIRSEKNAALIYIADSAQRFKEELSDKLASSGSAMSELLRTVSDFNSEIEILDIKISDIEIPDIKIPDIEISDIGISDIKIPDIKIPDIEFSGSDSDSDSDIEMTDIDNEMIEMQNQEPENN